MAISAGPLFKFNESISFMVSCETQAEIDRYWDQLSAVPAAEQFEHRSLHPKLRSSAVGPYTEGTFDPSRRR